MDRASSGEVLRIGRVAVERWGSTNAGLLLIARVALPIGRSLVPADLAPGIAELYCQSPSGKVTLVLESAWLPVILVDTGSALLSAAQVERLVQHRLGLHYGNGDDPVAGWEMRVERRAGDRHALAYGLSARLKDALLVAGRSAGIAWQAMVPAFDWGRQQCRAEDPLRHRGSGSNSWWVWTEQDRLLVARLDAGRVQGLNPALPHAEPADTSAAILAHIGAEQTRLGVEADTDPVLVGNWGPVHSWNLASDRVRWRGVAAATNVVTNPSTTPLRKTEALS